MEEQQDNEWVDGKQVTVTGVKMEMYDASSIKRIRFSTDIGDITWKPQVLKEEFLDGLKIEKRVSMDLGDIPDKLRKLGSKIQTDGSVKVKVSYAIFTKDADGEQVKYRFIRSQKTFDKWEF